MAAEAGPYPCWEFLDCDEEFVPPSRSGHTCALHKNRYLYIFGGFDGSNCFDDLYVLDLDARRWRKIEAGGDRPSGRASHSAVTDDLAGVMYIFGGSGSHFGYTNKRDLCEFCFETECWSFLSNPLEDTPSARYGQSMVAYQEGLYVWGGTHGTNYPTDMHRFDLCSKQWEYVATTGDLPCGRYRHQAMVKDDLMYIVGGSGINRYGDVFTFHFGTSVWRKLQCTGTDLSDGRYAHSAVLRDGYIYLYGGNDGVRHDDLQQLDLQTLLWSRVIVHGQCPPGRDFHAAVLRKDSMVIFGGSNGTRRHNDVFEFHMAPKIPQCTLAADMEALLDQAQTDAVVQWSCDVFLTADDGESAQGVFCHSHILYVRCPKLYQLVQESQSGFAFQPTVAIPPRPAAYTTPENAYSVPVTPSLGMSMAKVEERPATHAGELSSGRDGREDDTIDSLFRAVVTDDGSSTGVAAAAAAAQQVLRRPPPGWTAEGHCLWVPVDMTPTVLSHLVRYLYAETTKFGQLSAEQLYRLFLAARHLEVPRLAALCERQIKVRLGLDNVLPLLRASARDGPMAQLVQDACKHFFLANYNQCTELRECEALDPKLLCELMRLHNSRASANVAPGSGPSKQTRSGVASAGQAPLTAMSPTTASRQTAAEEPRGWASQREVGLGQVQIPPETLAEDLKRLLIEGVASDFEVVVQGEVILAHRFVLVARSRYFASCILNSGMVDMQAGRLYIPPDSAMTADAFRAFLRFLYAGDDILGVLTPHTAMYLVDASPFYGLTNLRLKHFCERYVRDSFTEAHVLQLFEASSRLYVEGVRVMALDFIISHFPTVYGNPALEQLDKPLLVEILKGLAERLPQPSINMNPAPVPPGGECRAVTPVAVAPGNHLREMSAEAGPYPCWEFLDCDSSEAVEARPVDLGPEEKFVPQSRSGHTCALHKNRYLYIFGGFDGSNCFDDLYVLDLDARRWRKVEAGGDRPSGRASHSAVTDDLAGVMYIFGGSGSHFGYTNKRDLCEFCFETECWRVLSNPLEDTPSARYGQSMVAYQEGLYVWGGTHGTNYPTDMHRFDLCSKQWEFVATTGDLPCGRYRHQAMVKDDVMYIVGGSGINRYGDVFTFHFGTNIWHKLQCTGTDLSDGRYAHSAVLREGYIYLYGGNDGVRHDDLQQLELQTALWSRVIVHGQCPPGRDFHAAVLREDSMVIFGGSNGLRRHNDVFEFHMAPKIPPCTLSADMEAILEQAQTDEAAQWSCDVFLAADGGESAQGVFCHSHIFFVRCPKLYQLVRESQNPSEFRVPTPTFVQPRPAEATLETACTMPATSLAVPAPKTEQQRPATHPGAPGEAHAGREDETIDSLLRAVVTEHGVPVGAAAGDAGRRASRLPPPGWAAAGHCTWVPVDMPHAILSHLMRYLYAGTTKFGRLYAEQLYRLFLTAKHLEVPRLAALCERQIKVRLGLDSVLPLLRASARDGPMAQPVQDACKHFFLANYNNCTELRECEALDPRLLCELMRLHNSRATPAVVASSGPSQQQRSGTVSAGQAPLAAPMCPQTPSRQATMEEQAGKGGVTQLGLGPVQIPPETLAEDLKRLLIEKVAPDFEVVVQDEVIHTHKLLLVARSRYFASCILTSGMVEAQAGRLVIPRGSAMTAAAFQAFLRFLYAGDDILGVLEPHTAMYLVDASPFYGLSNLRLKHFCEQCVRDSFNEAHVLQLFEASSRLNFEGVRTMALDFIIANFSTVKSNPALEQLDKPLLLEILKGLAEKLPQPSAIVSPSVPQSLG